MMKISDPIMFGHCVSVYYKDALDKHAAVLTEIGANVNNGLADVLEKLDRLPADKRAEIEADIAAVYKDRPALAMVDSRKGITNLHVPNNIIVDASMPNVVRDGGRMWNNDDELQDCIAMVRTVVTRPCTRKFSRMPRRTDSSIPRRWETSPTSV